MRPCVLLAAALSLVALPAMALRPDVINIDDDGGGKFSGHAGSAWTAEELPKMVGGIVCGGVPPKVFNLRILDGAWLFSGQC
jgi:hypothetical protein